MSWEEGRTPRFSGGTSRLKPGVQLILHSAFLGEHQIGLTASGHSCVTGAQPIGHRSQSDDGRHTDGDAY